MTTIRCAPGSAAVLWAPRAAPAPAACLVRVHAVHTLTGKQWTGRHRSPAAFAPQIDPPPLLSPPLLTHWYRPTRVHG